MSVIIDVIKEEKERIERNEQIYMKELKQLPKGAVVEKRRGNKIYYYISYRDKGKVKQEYLKLPMEKITELKKKIEKRRRLERSLRDLQKEKKLVQRMVAKHE
jgi:hypothetical protein